MKKKVNVNLEELNKKSSANSQFVVMDKKLSIEYDVRTWLQISKSINDLIKLFSCCFDESLMLYKENFASIYHITEFNDNIHEKTFDIIDENDVKIFNQTTK